MHSYMPPNPDTPAPRKLWWRGALFVVIAFVSGVGVTLAVVNLSGYRTPPHAKHAAASVSPSPETLTMSGTISMPRYDKTEDPMFRTANWTSTGSGDCEGNGGYSDIAEGADVTVYDAAGQVVGAGSLEAGTRDGDTCMWAFSVPGLPESTFYQVEVTHRGKVTVQRATVGFVELSLGD